MSDKIIGSFTALAYLMLVAIGAAMSVAGVITKSVALDFGVDNSVIGYCFSFFSVGYAAAVLGNGLILTKINVRTEIVVASILGIIAAVGAAIMNSVVLFAFFVFLFGLGNGVFCSLGYSLIVKLYTCEAERSAKLNILNFFFSVGAIVTPFLAGVALERGITWQGVLFGTLAPVFAVIFMALSQKNNVALGDKPSARETTERWGIKVYLVGVAMLCYVVSEMSFTYWVVPYMMEKLTLDVALGSLFLSVFWIFMAIGRFFTGVFIAKVNTINYLLYGSGAAFLLFIGMLGAGDFYGSFLLVAGLGLAFSGLYATLVAYGTEMFIRPSSKLTTFFLTIGSAAGILAFVVSSYSKQMLGLSATMFLAAILMGAVFSLMFIVGKVIDTKVSNS